MSGKKERWKSGEAKITAELDQRTRAALEERQKQFVAVHQNEDDDWFLEYVRNMAQAIGRSPYAVELIGGAFIAARFDGWNNVLKAAGLPPVNGIAPDLRKLSLYKNEFKHQAKLRRDELGVKQNQRKIVRQQESLLAKEEMARLAERQRDVEWVAAHKTDSDEELLAYLRRCAENLGHTPSMREVLGGSLISRRFGNWSVAIHLSGLRFHKGMKTPKQTAIDAYWSAKRKNEMDDR